MHEPLLTPMKWHLHKMARRGWRAICSKLYQDRNTDPSHSIIIAGTARSGTTWLADLIASQMPARIMFEPFHSELVPGFREFNYFRYMRPGLENQALLAFVRRVLTGQIRNSWIDRQVETLRPQWRVIKEIRACLFLRWMHDRFPEVPMVFIIRHPCAVVASRIRLNWNPNNDIEPFLVQQHLLDDFLGDHLPAIRKASTDAEKHAIIWCVSNLVPLWQFRDAPLHVMFYENLCQHPEAEIPNLFRAIGRPYTDTVFKYARRPSTTTRMQSAVVKGIDPTASWRRELSGDAIKRVLGIVKEFGLAHLYGDADLPQQKTANFREMTHGR